MDNLQHHQKIETFWSLNNHCLAKDKIYEATVRSNKFNHAIPKPYISKIKVKFANHKISFNHKHCEKETELCKEV